MKKRGKRTLIFALCCMLLCACACRAKEEKAEQKLPVLPEKIDEFAQKIPLLDVYVTQKEGVERMTLEEYLCGVVAGEMNGEWPMEALKAQAILARTFVLRFMTEKESKYEGADVSTDIEEAQAYDDEAVNARIREAVESTKGLVLSYEGEFPYAWFHAHSGGQTAGAIEGLNWKAEEPGYTQSVPGREKDAAMWEAAFEEAEVKAAAAACGIQVEKLDTVREGKRGPSGRLITLEVNGQEISAADFRVEIGSSKMKSTYIEELAFEGGKLYLRGKGYGHGVGMSQWGAREMALEGADALEIIDSYFRNIAVVKIY